MSHFLTKIKIESFKSIRHQQIDLRHINVLIGANGTGKSNFIKIFSLLNSLVKEGLQLFIGQEGGADNLLHHSQKETDKISFAFDFGQNRYACELVPAEGDTLVFSKEECAFHSSGYNKPYTISLGQGHRETKLSQSEERVARYVLEAVKLWIVYHFHDTSTSAKIRKSCDLNDNKFLRADASNIAAFLYYLQERHFAHYSNIVETIRQVAPFFDNFELSPLQLKPDSIQLQWRHKGSARYFNGHALSDGTLRFICLATVLLQPSPPSTILIDEPELGLHPQAINLLAEMLKSVSTRSQILISTQSVTLINHFEPDAVIVTDREDDETIMRRLDPKDMESWLEDYGLGELWEKNIFGGRP